MRLNLKKYLGSKSRSEGTGNSFVRDEYFIQTMICEGENKEYSDMIFFAGFAYLLLETVSKKRHGVYDSAMHSLTQHGLSISRSVFLAVTLSHMSYI